MGSSSEDESDVEVTGVGKSDDAAVRRAPPPPPPPSVDVADLFHTLEGTAMKYFMDKVSSLLQKAKVSWIRIRSQRTTYYQSDVHSFFSK